MSQIEAVFEDGVFRPLESVDLAEKQRVRLQVEPVQDPALREVEAWLERVRGVQQRIIAERGYFPDSTLDIAADRLRDA